MIELILCDDMPELVDELEGKLTKIAAGLEVDVHIHKFYSGEQLLFSLEERPAFADIIFLDVLMGKTNGIETAKKLRDFGCQAPIIFLTSSEEYVFDSFDVDALNYLLKDHIDDQKLKENFMKAMARAAAKETEYFTCEMNRVTKQIPLTDILYFEVRNRLVTVHFSEDQTFDFYSKMEQLEQKLGSSGFIRTHRSFLVHLKYVDTFTSNTVDLLNGESIPMGPSYSKAVREAFSRYLLD